jgi:Co/Zn/Cd efflux system component
MGAVGLSALVANAASFVLLWAYRDGDANMRSAWICMRNDVLGNVAVLLAAVGVFGTGTSWPDLIVAAVMALLAVQGALIVLQQSSVELLATAGKLTPSPKGRRSRIRCQGGFEARAALRPRRRLVGA